MSKNTKYVFVCGGVMSGVGKGITTSSIGTILKSRGYNVTLMKADPYLNVDAGTMNPTEHGEVFVLDSGLETDQDMGNYERFLGQSVPKENYMTNGMVFKHVIDKERALGYKGKCVEPTYHITEEILRRINLAKEVNQADILIIEIGGTVGEYQNAIFLEAARQIKIKNRKDVLFVMVSYLPVPKKIGEMKTKPTQNAVSQLNSYGIHPDFIVCRSEYPVDKKRKEKIANMTGVAVGNVISAPDIKTIYQVPLNFEADGFTDTLLEALQLPSGEKDLKEWRQLNDKIKNATPPCNIAIVGKYFDSGDFVLSDAYISVIEAIKSACYHQDTIPNISWLNAKDYEKNPEKVKELAEFDGIIVPGGFGETGIEGKILAIKYARENKIPYFGLCYGMQLMVIEYARHVAGLTNANTVEIEPNTDTPVIDILPEQKKVLADKHYGGSMRLGSYPAILKEETIAYKAYGQKDISERHRHRYEVNPDYIQKLEDSGLIFSGKSPSGVLMEIAELNQKDHPFMLGTQFHPEFTSTPLKPQPLFAAFIQAAKENKS